MTEEMSRAKAKVLAVYPEGALWAGYPYRSLYRVMPITNDNDYCIGPIGFGGTPEEAWLDAASRIPAEPKDEAAPEAAGPDIHWCRFCGKQTPHTGNSCNNCGTYDQHIQRHEPATEGAPETHTSLADGMKHAARWKEKYPGFYECEVCAMVRQDPPRPIFPLPVTKEEACRPDCDCVQYVPTPYPVEEVGDDSTDTRTAAMDRWEARVAKVWDSRPPFGLEQCKTMAGIELELELSKAKLPQPVTGSAEIDEIDICRDPYCWGDYCGKKYTSTSAPTPPPSPLPCWACGAKDRVPAESDLRTILGVGQKFPDAQKLAIELVQMHVKTGEHTGEEHAELMYALDVIVNLLRLPAEVSEKKVDLSYRLEWLRPNNRHWKTGRPCEEEITCDRLAKRLIASGDARRCRIVELRTTSKIVAQLG